jgi:glycine/D-amino acid oxidase-like deaminating enzyme
MPAEPTLSRRAFVGAALAAPLGAASVGPVRATSPTGAPSSARAARDHVVVVGAGAFGGWTALALRRAGHRVTLVDAWGAGHARASSGGETRVIRAVYGGEPVYTRMAVRALALWREAERDLGRPLLVPTGALWLCAGDDGYVRRSLAPVRAAGVPLDELTPGEAARRWPQLGFDDVRTVFHEPQAGFLMARLACELVRDRLVREGGTYRQAWARPGEASGGRLARVALGDGGAIEADRFVFACGPWLGSLFPDVVGRRIVATRQEVYFFGPPPGDARFDVGALPAWVHIGERFAYGLPNHERRGLKVADDTAGPEVDPTSLERQPSAAGLATARAILRARFPAMADAPLVESRVCQYEASSDGNFLVDRHPGLANVWLVGGGSGHGFKMGPALGEHVAAVVDGHAAVEPLFALGRPGLRPRPSST